MMIDLPSYGYTGRIKLGSFLRQRPLILNYSGSEKLTDFQVKCTLAPSDIPFEKLRADKQDLLFVDNNNELIPYWIEKADASEIVVWLKFSEIEEGKTVLWLHYGNGNFAGMSNASKVFLKVIDGLVAGWHFDEGSGPTAFDSSGNNNDGTIYGANWTQGKFGWALSFDGIDDYVSCGSNINVDAVSVEAWVNAAEMDRYDRLVQRANEDGKGFALRISPYDGFMFQAKAYSVDFNIASFNKFANTWYHVVGVWDGNSDHAPKIYVNGIEGLDTFTDNAGDGGGTVLEIGRRANKGQNYFKGIIDEVKIYNKALTEKEIIDLYNNYGYSTENCSNKVLVCKIADTPPTIEL